MLSKLIILCISIVLVNANCGPCPEIPKHYEELGCKGIQDQFDCCPTRFECPDFKTYDTTKCHFKGRSYDILNELDDSETPSGLAACRCLNYTETATFNCAHIECPELFGRHDPNCIRQYSLDKTCSINKVCVQSEIDRLHKCYYQNKEYYDGQLIYPSDGCYKCLCNEAYDNSTGSQFSSNCKKIDCKIEILYLDRIKQGCVPVYFGANSCCPIEFQCPSAKDQVVAAGRSVDVNPNKTCKHGDHTLAVGDSLTTGVKCLECTCVKPPMLQCIKTRSC